MPSGNGMDCCGFEYEDEHEEEDEEEDEESWRR
jgi:hypothetical protein